MTSAWPIIAANIRADRPSCIVAIRYDAERWHTYTVDSLQHHADRHMRGNTHARSHICTHIIDCTPLGRPGVRGRHSDIFGAFSQTIPPHAPSRGDHGSTIMCIATTAAARATRDAAIARRYALRKAYTSHKRSHACQRRRYSCASMRRVRRTIHVHSCHRAIARYAAGCDFRRCVSHISLDARRWSARAYRAAQGRRRVRMVRLGHMRDRY